MLTGLPAVEGLIPQPKRIRLHADFAVDKGQVRPWLGAGEHTVTRWPGDCNPTVLGESWGVTSFNNLAAQAADDNVSIWFRGRPHSKAAKKEGATGSKYWLFWLNGPEGSVLPWYPRVRKIMGLKRGSFQGLPHARKLDLFELTNLGLNIIQNPLAAERGQDVDASASADADLSDDDEVPGELETFLDARRHLLDPGQQVAPDEALGNPARQALVDASEYPHEAELQERFAEMCKYAKQLLQVHGAILVCDGVSDRVPQTMRNARAHHRIVIMFLCCLVLMNSRSLRRRPASKVMSAIMQACRVLGCNYVKVCGISYGSCNRLCRCLKMELQD